MYGKMSLRISGFMCLLVIECVQCSSPNVQHQVYTQTYTGDEFIFSRGIPTMTELTICMWLKGNDGSSGEHIFSYAVEDEDNEFLIVVEGCCSLYVYINGHREELDTFVDTDFNPHIEIWNRHCWTWKSGSYFKWYTTMYDDDTLDLHAYVDHGEHTVRGGGGIVLMHDQDSLLGGMTGNDGLEGDVANFRMWDYELDITQLNALTCLDEGNLISQTYMNYTFVTPSQLRKEEFPCENYRFNEEMERNVNGVESTIAMCLVREAKLLNHVIMTFTASSKSRCISVCSMHANCKSINFHIGDRTCDINNEAATSYKAVLDFNNQLSEDNIYASTTVCL